MRARLVNESAGSKDIVRIKSLREKSKGDPDKEIQYAENMAKAITKAGKAQARGEAAIFVFQGPNPVSDVFFKRVSELTGGEAIESTASKMPGEKPSYRKWKQPASQLISNEQKGGSGGGFSRTNNPHAALGIGDYGAEVKVLGPNDNKYGRESSILPIGKVNLMSGNSDHFNIFDNQDAESYVEVWKTEKGAFKIILTSGQPSPINLLKDFRHDQSWRSIFRNAKMVDYTMVKDMPGLIPFYGRSLNGYVYK